MSVSSMTGFARSGGEDASHSWTWEAKSVNGRGLDVRCRLPAGMDALEQPIRQAVSKRLKRGSVSVSLQLSQNAGVQPMGINRPWLEEIMAVVGDVGPRDGIDPPRLDGLLALRGVIENVEAEADDDEREAREKALLESLGTVLADLDTMRRAEGAKLHEIVAAQLDEVASLTARAEACVARHPEMLAKRLRSQIDALMQAGSPVGEERLAQELAVLATKADVREELDRLRTHCEAAAKLLAEGDAVGRKLDFLSQEFNREANTVCSKAADVELTGIGLELKAVIDRFREQVQNIE